MYIKFGASLLLHYILCFPELSHITITFDEKYVFLLFGLLFFSSTFTDLSLSCSLASPSVTLFPPSALGAVRDEHKTGESVSCGEPQTKITGTFFYKDTCASTHT